MPATDPSRLEAVLGDLLECGFDPKSIRSWASHREPLVRRNRHQVIDTFPLFAVLVATHGTIPVHLEIGAAIDRGDPLVAAMASILGVTKTSIRFLQGKGPALLGADWFNHPADLLEAIDCVPPEKLPRSCEDWRIFRQFWLGCGELYDQRYCRRPPPVKRSDVLSQHMLAGLCNAGYASSARKLGRLWNGDLARLAGVKDYFRFVGDWCEAGAGISERQPHLPVIAGSLRNDLLRRYSAMELIRQSERWHREIARLAAVALTPDTAAGFLEWPALPGLPLRSGELLVCSLTNPAQLQLEGSRLNHCVSFHFRSCVTGESHIVSIRNGKGESLSTAEIVIHADDEGKWVPTVVQHQAHSNSVPSKACEAALTEALGVLIEANVQLRLQEIQNLHAGRQEEVAACLAVNDLGYSVDFYGAVMAVALQDYDMAIAWLERRLHEEEGWYRYRNEQAGERLDQLGFDDELTDERAFELYRDSGVEECLDAGI